MLRFAGIESGALSFVGEEYSNFEPIHPSIRSSAHPLSARSLRPVRPAHPKTCSTSSRIDGDSSRFTNKPVVSFSFGTPLVSFLFRPKASIFDSISPLPPSPASPPHPFSGSPPSFTLQTLSTGLKLSVCCSTPSSNGLSSPNLPTPKPSL